MFFRFRGNELKAEVRSWKLEVGSWNIDIKIEH